MIVMLIRTQRLLAPSIRTSLRTTSVLVMDQVDGKNALEVDVAPADEGPDGRVEREKSARGVGDGDTETRMLENCLVAGFGGRQLLQCFFPFLA
jgi:hypothetical protein